MAARTYPSRRIATGPLWLFLVLAATGLVVALAGFGLAVAGEDGVGALMMPLGSIATGLIMIAGSRTGVGRTRR